MEKKDRELSDDSVIKARKRQLDLLQERRDKIEMMVEWQYSLIDLDEEATQKAGEFWDELVMPYVINKTGEKLLQQWIKRYGLAVVLESIRASPEQYLKTDENGKLTHESAGKAFDYIPKVCAGKKRFDSKPYLRELYYIRGIMKNRFSYLNEWKAIEIMEAAHKAGVDIEEIKQVALDSKNWTEWQIGISALSIN